MSDHNPIQAAPYGKLKGSKSNLKQASLCGHLAYSANLLTVETLGRFEYQNAFLLFSSVYALTVALQALGVCTSLHTLIARA